MKEKLTVAYIQADLVWENSRDNRVHFQEKIEAAPIEVDLIILPEMFSTGFTMNPKNVAETMDGETIGWMQGLAQKHGLAITGSLVIKENECYFNRLVFVHPSGQIQTYDKRHTFTLAGEHKAYTAGKSKLIVEYLGWKICPLICYDLRFPVWARNVEDYDVLIYVANWPKPRIAAWDTLLKARAIENMCYSIGVNRVGLDSNQYEYIGHSAIYDPLGVQISDKKENQEATETVVLSKNKLIEARKRFQFLADKDTFEIKS